MITKKRKLEVEEVLVAENEAGVQLICLKVHHRIGTS